MLAAAAAAAAAGAPAAPPRGGRGGREEREPLARAAAAGEALPTPATVELGRGACARSRLRRRIGWAHRTAGAARGGRARSRVTGGPVTAPRAPSAGAEGESGRAGGGGTPELWCPPRAQALAVASASARSPLSGVFGVAAWFSRARGLLLNSRQSVRGQLLFAFPLPVPHKQHQQDEVTLKHISGQEVLNTTFLVFVTIQKKTRLKLRRRVSTCCSFTFGSLPVQHLAYSVMPLKLVRRANSMFLH
ncbi:uncharacterized protein LOC115345859 [Aquila chrysaetos chrysaetos]|uniref:uncharacterized protein LOC115345859 n=1 Tax=Aquila chrysaetos chrysaetos TaxID=223781 RepID=UPI00117731AB|nr:uncharacterized protein LOC115345859 [Aquila chrysaetos chrysaetos]